MTEKFRKLFLLTIKQEQTLMSHCREQVIRANGELFLRICLACAVLLLLLLFASTFAPGFDGLSLPYMLLFIASCACWILLRQGLEGHPSMVMPCVYALVIGFFFFSIYLSTVISSRYPAVTVIGVLLMAPSLVLDRTWRIDLLMTIYFLVFILCSCLFKAPETIQPDLINGSAFLIFGLISGQNIRHTKLLNIDNELRLIAQRNTDELTGLHSRRLLFELLGKQEMSEAVKPYAGVLMLDVDSFKQYNDAYGHLMGDDCLRRLGACMRAFGEKNGLQFFRYGGEEFAVLAEDGDEKALRSKAEALARAVYELNIPFERAPVDGRISVSIGYAVRTDDFSAGYEALIGRADEALYCAKEHHRGGAVCFAQCDARDPKQDVRGSSSLRQRE